MDDICSVCWTSTETFVRPCAHLLCRSCADDWFARDLSCPMCRQTPSGLVTPNEPLDRVCFHIPRTVLKVVQRTHRSGAVHLAVYRNLTPYHHKTVQPGDVIVSINNIRVTTLKQMRCLWRRAKAAGEIQIEVSRPTLRERASLFCSNVLSTCLYATFQ